MRVAVVHNYSIKPYMIAHPIRTFSTFLLAQDIHINFFHRPDDPRIAEHDAVLILEGDFRSLFPQEKQTRQTEIDTVVTYRNRGQAVIWFDESASSGMVRDYLLPYVDFYLKTQLLKDRTAYTRESPYGIIYRDYYHERYGVEDSNRNPRDPVKSEYLDKLGVGWNIGLGDLNTLAKPKFYTRFRYRFPSRHYKFDTTPPELVNRSIDIVYRVSRATGSVNTHKFQRVEVRKQLDLLREEFPNYVYRMDGKVPKKVYDQEMRGAVVVLSPFGDGEMCYRDFEGFLWGGVLIKPSMEHVEMRPNFYLPGETYIPLAWDFSDFREKVLDVLKNRKQYEDMARHGQAAYVEALSPKGGEAFATHFREIIEQGLMRRRA